MTNEDGGAADPAQRASYVGDVVRGSVEAVLGGYHLVTFSLKCRNYLAKARAVRPEPVTEEDARFGLGRFHFVLLVRLFGCVVAPQVQPPFPDASRIVLR